MILQPPECSSVAHPFFRKARCAALVQKNLTRRKQTPCMPNIQFPPRRARVRDSTRPHPPPARIGHRARRPHLPLLSAPPHPIGRKPISQGTLVFSWHPCHPFMRSPSTALTMRCCLSMLAPRKRSELISMPYMDPHPPEMSCTTSSTGANSLARRSQTSDSASLRKSGFSIVPAARAGASADSADAAGAARAVEAWSDLAAYLGRTGFCCCCCRRGIARAAVARGRVCAGRRQRGAWLVERTLFAAFMGVAAGRVARTRVAHLWQSILTRLRRCAPAASLYEGL